ncbi:MAG: WG repeat-containing protein [Firmicutes bacterium]|nr:WG repeat-containing protein [Bacillota bacterium]
MKKILIILFIIIGCLSRCTAESLVLFEDENGLSGYKDARGRVVIEAKYIFAEPFSKYGIAPVCDVERGWIYIDHHENFIIKPYFIKNNNDFDRFSEGLARYEENGRIGFFNERGQVVIKACFEFASPFKNGLAAVARNVRWEKHEELEFIKTAEVGFINKQGDLQIPYLYENLIRLFDENGTAVVVREGKNVVINSQGDVLKEYQP